MPPKPNKKARSWRAFLYPKTDKEPSVAITTTPLGFQKPDGNEPFRQGNDVISANAQKAQDLFAADKARLALLEQSAGFPGDPVELADECCASSCH